MVNIEKASKIYEMVERGLEDIKYLLTLNPLKERTNAIQGRLRKLITKLNQAR